MDRPRVATLAIPIFAALAPLVAPWPACALPRLSSVFGSGEHQLPISALETVRWEATEPDTSAGPPGTMRLGSGASLHAGLRMTSAGSLGERFAYRVGGEVLGREGRARSGEARVQMNGLGAASNLRLTAGVFDAGLPMISSPQRTTRERYLSPVELDARGIELDETRARWTFGAGLSDSPRHLPAMSARPLHRLEDTYFRVIRDLGGPTVGAQWLFDRQDSDLPTHSWLQHLQGEVAARLGNDRVAVTPAYTFSRLDDRPGPGLHERHQFALVESRLTPDRARHWLLTTRVEHDYRSSNALRPERDANLEVMDLSCRVEARMRIAVEYSRLADNTGGPRSRRLDAIVQLGH